MRSLAASKRIWLPFAAAALCLVAASWSGAILTWVLLIAAIGFVLDGVTLLWSRSGSLRDHSQ
jgi:hypothetical protein